VAQDGLASICHGGSRKRFLPYQWKGYDEALLLYVLALAHRHTRCLRQLRGVAASYEWKRCYDTEYLYAGPLFTHQLSTSGSISGYQDAFMRGKGIDYFENSRAPRTFSSDMRSTIRCTSRIWRARLGITASDGPVRH